MDNRLINPCTTQDISKDTVELLHNIQKRCVECGSTWNLELHHRVFRSRFTPMLFKKFIEDRSEQFGKTLFWGLHSPQNLVVLCMKCHGDLHSRRNDLVVKYEESFTDILNGRNIFYNKDNYKVYQ